MEEGGDVSLFLEAEEESPRLASSLITLPTYIQNPAKIPTDMLAMLAQVGRMHRRGKRGNKVLSARPLNLLKGLF